MSRIYRKGISGGEGSGSSFIESVSESFEVVLKELKLKAGAITNTFLGNESVTNEKVKAKSLEGNRLAKETLGNEEIQTNAVDARVIAAGAVENSELGTEAVTNGKVKKESLEPNRLEKEKLVSEQVKLHGLTIDRLKEGEITEAYLAEALTGLYVKLAGRPGGQTTIGNTEASTESKGFIIKSDGPLIERKGKITSASNKVKELSKTSDLTIGEAVQCVEGGIPALTTLVAKPSESEIELSKEATETGTRTLRFVGTRISSAWLEVLGTEKVIIRKGQGLGILEVAQITGLEQLVAAGLVKGGSVEAVGSLTVGGQLIFSESTKTLETSETSGFNAGAGSLLRLSTTVEPTFVSSIEFVSASTGLLTIANIGKKPITFRKDEEKTPGNIENGSKIIKGLERSSERYKLQTVTASSGLGATTISTVLSETEIEVVKAATKTETVTLTINATGAAAQRLRLSTGRDIELVENRRITFVYDKTTGRWYDIGQSRGLASTPTPSGTENTVVSGVTGVPQKFVASYTGDGATKTAKVKHNLNTFAIVGSAQTSVSGHPSVVTNVKTTAISVNEAELEFTVAPAKGEVFFLTVVG